MRYLFSIIFFFLYSCGYPDIDTVPKFENLIITKDESIDLCKITNTNNIELDKCLNLIKSNQDKK